MDYNLLDEKWIPVLYRDGRWERVGIRKAIKDAAQIRQIAASNPMDRVATLRFLLGLLYWCKGNPPNDANTDIGESLPLDWLSRLNDKAPCFNLLGQGQRFYQDRGARRSRAATDLLQEVPTGNNFWHFRHSTDEKDGLCLACCAIGLLRLPLFSVSGLPNLKAGINGTPPVYVVPWGPSLLKTLLANWRLDPALGEPAWVKQYAPANPGENVPLLAGLTMLSRRVWLHDPEPDGTCIACGSQKISIVRTCEFQTAGKQETDLWGDPHVVYLDKTPRKAAKASDLSAAGKFKMDRPWPDLLARMVESGFFGSEDKARSFLLVGFATDQAKNIDVWERTVVVRSGASVRKTSAAILSQWQKEGSRLARKLRPPSEKKSSRKYVEISASLASIRPHVEGRVAERMDELLTNADSAWERAAQEYHRMTEVVAKSISPGFTVGAMQRRRQIAHAAPDTQGGTEEAMEPNPKKGGDK